MGSKEHVIGLDGGANEEASKGQDWKAEALGEVLVEEGLRVSASTAKKRAEENLRWSSSL